MYGQPEGNWGRNIEVFFPSLLIQLPLAPTYIDGMVSDDFSGRKGAI
jgi:hypothetical protein